MDQIIAIAVSTLEGWGLPVGTVVVMGFGIWFLVPHLKNKAVTSVERDEKLMSDFMKNLVDRERRTQERLDHCEARHQECERSVTALNGRIVTLEIALGMHQTPQGPPAGHD